MRTLFKCDYIDAGGYIDASDYIDAGDYIDADEYIDAGDYIRTTHSCMHSCLLDNHE